MENQLEYVCFLPYALVCKDNKPSPTYCVRSYTLPRVSEGRLCKTSVLQSWLCWLGESASPPLKKPPVLNSSSPTSSGPTPTRATPLALKLGSSLLTSEAVHLQIWQPNLRKKKITAACSRHSDPSSTICKTQTQRLIDRGSIWHQYQKISRHHIEINNLINFTFQTSPKEHYSRSHKIVSRAVSC